MEIFQRKDINIIYDMIQPHSKVLDLGCGDGSLLAKLKCEKNIIGQGVEYNMESVCACLEKGVPVIQADLNQGLKDFPSQAYDYVILSQTLQLLDHPDQLLTEMLNIGKIGIVSIFNYGFWLNRLRLLFTGSMMPKGFSFIPPGENVHLSILTIHDFLQFISTLNVQLLDFYYLQWPLTIPLKRHFPASLFCYYAIYKLSAK